MLTSGFLSSRHSLSLPFAIGRGRSHTAAQAPSRSTACRAGRMDLSSRSAGLASAFLGVLAVGPDAALLRVQQLSGGSTSVIGVWRYTLLMVCNAVAGMCVQGGVRPFVAGIARSWSSLAIATCFIVLINAGFTISLIKVDPAKALLLISLNPLWAALLGKLVLRDTLPRRTIIAQLLSLLSTLLVFTPNLLEALGARVESDGGGPEPESLPSATSADSLPSATGDDRLPSAASVDANDFVPLATGFAVASFLTYSRYVSLHREAVSLDAAPALGAAATSIFALGFVLLVEEGELSDLVSGLRPAFWLALFGSALGSACYDIALVIAPRSLMSAEVALILLGETIFGPLWVWFGFGDVPSPWTLAGGALLLATLAAHELLSMRETKKANRRLPLRSQPSLAPALPAPLRDGQPGAEDRLDARPARRGLELLGARRGHRHRHAHRGAPSQRASSCRGWRGARPWQWGLEWAHEEEWARRRQD